MPRAKTYQHPTLMSTDQHAALIDAQRLAPPDVIPTLTAADIAAAIRRDSDRTAERERKQENRARANRALVALKAYRTIPGIDPDALLRDLLADLMHYCDGRPEDFEMELSAAQNNYEAERNGED